MDFTTQSLRLAHCCQRHGQLQKLVSSRRSCVSCRSCRATSKPIKHKSPNFSWATPCSVSARSSSAHHQSGLWPLSSSLSEGPSEAAAPISDRPNEAVPEGALASERADEGNLEGAHASDKSNVSVQRDAYASEKPNGGIVAGVHSSERPHEGLLASTRSLDRPNLQNEDFLPDSHASGRENKGFLAASNNVVDAGAIVLGPWNEIPHRYKLIFTTSLAFVICNMDKVNLSVAIIPMSNQLHWNASTSGLVQSSFFWGYILSQLPGGWLARWFTGEAVLGAGVFVWSIATATVPIAASFLPALLFARLIVGLGEGVSPSAATDLIARNVPTTERSRAVAFVFNGLNVGSIFGLVLAPVIIEHFGWESVFYIFGVLGIVWCIGFTFSEWNNPWESWDQGNLMNFMHTNKTDVYPSGKAIKPHDSSTSSFTDHEKIPWKAFFRSQPVWAMIYTHFCGNWGHYCIMAWLPTYLSEELNLDLTNAALVAVLPPLGGTFVSGFAATMADHLISKGLYCTHQDISPKYASVLLGITNTAGAIPGILGVYLTGVMLDQTHSWTMALFVPCIFFWITGAFVWNIFASSESLSFDN